MLPVLEMANKHYAYGKLLQNQAAKDLLGLWRQVDKKHIVPSWRELLPYAVASITAVQLAAAEDAASYTTAALAVQKLDTTGPVVNPPGFAGVAYQLEETKFSFDLAQTLAAPAYATLTGIKRGFGVDRAMAGGLNQLMLRSQLQVADAARQSSGVVMATRKTRTMYVRMLNPPSCSRCTILAGKYYSGNEGFLRHPGCDCRHIPVAESIADELTVNPYEYFKSLDPAEQDRIFTKAGARAIRDDADIFQVVNARSGIYTTAGGSKVTREGTTRRGYWGAQQQTRSADRKAGERYGVSIRQRMMPEEIYKRAKTQGQALRMLEDYGYITGAGQVPEGVIRGSVAGTIGGRKPSYSYSPATGEWN